MQLRKKPYGLLLLTGLTPMPFAFVLFRQNSVVDIHLHDTYFVIAHSHLLWVFSSLTLIIWLFYLLTNKILFSKALTWTHVIVTMVTIVALSWTLLFGDRILNPAPRRYFDYSEWNAFQPYAKWDSFISLLIIILILAQSLFFLNIIAGVLSKVFKRGI